MSTATSVQRPARRVGPLFLLTIWLALSAGCTVTLISRYDEQIDKSATALQRKMDGFLTSLEATPQPTYQDKKNFYSDYLVELRSVLVRAQSHPNNTITEHQLELMIQNLEALRQLHEAGPVDGQAIATTRDLFNQAWRAIITLELAKKRGS